MLLRKFVKGGMGLISLRSARPVCNLLLNTADDRLFIIARHQPHELCRAYAVKLETFYGY